MNTIAYAPRSILSSASLSMIRFYRTFLSRYKPGFCAFGLTGAGPTCSTYAMHIFSTESFSDSVALLSKRFQECHYAAQQLDLGKTYSCLGLVTTACCCYAAGAEAEKNNPRAF